MHGAGNAVLVPTEVDQPVMLLVTAAPMTGRDLALVVTTAGLLLAEPEPLRGLCTWRQIGEVGNARAAASRTVGL